MNGLLGDTPQGVRPGAHGQVITGGVRGPQSVLGQQPQAAELLDRSGDQEEFAGASLLPRPWLLGEGPEPGVPGVPAPSGHN